MIRVSKTGREFIDEADAEDALLDKLIPMLQSMLPGPPSEFFDSEAQEDAYYSQLNRARPRS